MDNIPICHKANKALIWGICCLPFCFLFFLAWLTDGMRINSEFFGILVLLSPICALTAIILGIGALVQINDSRGLLQGRGRAIAGIVCGTFWFYVILALIIYPFFKPTRESCVPGYRESRQQIAMVEKPFVPLPLS